MKRLLVLIACLAAACSGGGARGPQPLDASAFATEVDGRPVSLHTLRSPGGLTVQITEFGARVVALWAPDREGRYDDVVVGCESIGRYLGEPDARFYGPVVGRCANRIAGGRFVLDGKAYSLPQNDHGHSLHGGLKGLDSRVWTVESVTDRSLALSYTSPAGEEGYPGTLDVRVTYTVTDDNALEIVYRAETDAPTIVNLSNHSMFNLRGEGNGTVEAHELWIDASHITPVDSLLIPTGGFRPVEGTPFDFRTPTAIGARIDADDAQLRCGSGYDHNWVFDSEPGRVRLAASLYEPESGRLMEILTDQPGLQFYSGNFFTDVTTGKFGRRIVRRGAVALETQCFPDSPNQPGFPSVRLDPGEVYRHTCIYRFGIR